MEKLGIFYGSNRGKSEFTAHLLKDLLRDKFDIHIFNVANGLNEIHSYNKMIFITGTYGAGELQPDWIRNLETLKKIDFSGKTVGIIGRGNQGFFAATFVNSMKPLYDIIIKNGGNVKGFTSSKDYSFEKSTALIDEKFVGLPLDEMFMLEETKSRIINWLKKWLI